MARAGTIPCYKVGRIYRFKLDRLERWLAAKEQKCRMTQVDPIVWTVA